MTKNTRTDEILAAARALIGTRFVHQGRRPEDGLDCVGLLVTVASKTGIPHVDSIQYGRNGILRRTLEAGIGKSLVKVCDRWRPALAAPGDVLLVAPSHAMILAQIEPETRVIEAHPEFGVTERRVDREILQHVFAVYRFQEGTCP